MSAEIAAELVQLAVELSGEPFAEPVALVGEQIDVVLYMTELLVGQRVEPGGDPRVRVRSYPRA